MKEENNGLMNQINNENKIRYESVGLDALDFYLANKEGDINDYFNKERYISEVKHNSEIQSIDYESYDSNIYYRGESNKYGIGMDPINIGSTGVMIVDPLGRVILNKMK